MLVYTKGSVGGTIRVEETEITQEEARGLHLRQWSDDEVLIN